MTSLFRQLVESGEFSPSMLRAITSISKSEVVACSSRVKSLRAELALAEKARLVAEDRADVLAEQQDKLHIQTLEPIRVALAKSKALDVDVGATAAVAPGVSYPMTFVNRDETVDTNEMEDIADV